MPQERLLPPEPGDFDYEWLRLFIARVNAEPNPTWDALKRIALTTPKEIPRAR